jgi:hypothetical protein
VTRFLLIVAAVSAFAGPGSAQEFAGVRLSGDGVEVFAGLLHFHGLKPATPYEFDQSPPADRVILHVGTDRGANARRQRLTRETLAGGGSVLWAGDSGPDFDGVLQDGTRLTISGTQATAADPARCLGGDLSRPFLVPRPLDPAATALLVGGVALPDPAALLLSGLPNVATFLPSVLANVPTGGKYAWRELASLPPGTAAAGRPAARRSLVAVTSSGTGAKTHRALVVANSNVFANQLLAEEGADNLAFANNVVVWLSDGGRRKSCLLVHNGTPVPRFDAVTFQQAPPIPPLPPIPIPDFLNPDTQAKLANLANETLGKLEANNAFNRLITGDPEENPGRLRKFLQQVAVAFAVLALVLVARRLLGAKHAPDHTPVPRDPARTGPPDTAARQREELLQRGEYRGLVADYLRGWFAECGAAAGPDVPEISVRPGTPDKPVRAALRILWGVAFDAPPAATAARHAVPYARWKQLEPMIHAAQAGHEAGDWRFAAPKEPA